MGNKENIDLKQIKVELTRFMMSYKFALSEMNTKINILKEEFQYIHDYNPIEHVTSRLKTPESIIKKVNKNGYELSITSIKENIKDIAGIRITCSFISDAYEISNMIQNQKDVTLIQCKDYIKEPKPNGYRSLHLILEIPIFMSDRTEDICVEVQIRTIAMDFWASLEHKIYYKYDKKVPDKLLMELKDAAESISELDKKMEGIHRDVKDIKKSKELNDAKEEILIDNERLKIPREFLTQYFKWNE